MYIIRTVAPDQQAEQLKKFPLSEPKDWELIETFAGKDLRVGYYDTKEEAEAAKGECKFFDDFRAEFEAWEDEMADKFGKEPHEIHEAVKAIL